MISLETIQKNENNHVYENYIFIYSNKNEHNLKQIILIIV